MKLIEKRNYKNKPLVEKIWTWDTRKNINRGRMFLIFLFLIFCVGFINQIESLQSEHREMKMEVPIIEVPQSKSYKKTLEDIIHEKSNKYNLDHKLVKSIITHESKWKKFAKGKSNDIGLMQVLIINMTDTERKNPFDYENNIEAGTRYLRGCFDKHRELKKSVSCYNVGLNGKYNSSYVNAVMSHYR